MLLALDIGGTKVAAARVENGQMVARRQLPMASSAEGFARLMDDLVQGWPAPTQVAVATTGFVDAGKVRGVNLNIISFWDGFALADALQTRFACPVHLVNDAQAAAWGEYLVRQSEGVQSQDLLFITLSTGVGGGLVLGGQLRTGPHGLAGHVGHSGLRLQASDGQQRCGCGRDGCLELIASGTALARQATAAFGRPVSSVELFALAAHEPRAQAIIDHAAQAVAEALAGWHMILDVSEVVVGGSVGLAEGMLARIQTALAALPLAQPPRVSAARLGADAGLMGVMAWATACA